MVSYRGFLFLPLILMLVVKRNQLFKYYLSWFLPIIIYAGLLSSIGSIPNWDNPLTSNLLCALRGIAGMCMGACLYYVCNNMKRNDRFSAISYICFGLLVLTACFANVGNMSVAPFLLGALSIVGVVSNNENNLAYRTRKLCIHMGKISLPIYCLHYQVMQYVHFFYKFSSWKNELIVDLLITILLSEICMKIVESVREK